jgi:hypothetical protein
MDIYLLIWGMSGVRWKDVHPFAYLRDLQICRGS